MLWASNELPQVDGRVAESHELDVTPLELCIVEDGSTEYGLGVLATFVLSKEEVNDLRVLVVASCLVLQGLQLTLGQLLLLELFFLLSLLFEQLLLLPQ